MFGATSAGAATITATSTQDTTKSGSAVVTVTAAAAITGVSVNCSPGSIQLNQTSTCTPTVSGTGSFSSTVTWSVSPSGIGRVSSNGVFTSASTGTAIITATSTQDTAKSGSASVTITSTPPTITSVSVSCNPSAVLTDQSSQCTASVQGTGNYSTAVNWGVNSAGSGNSSVGTISSSGLYLAPLTVPNPSTVTISATSQADSTKSGSTGVSLAYPVPTVSLVSPSSASINSGGTLITLAGTGFTPSSAVNANGVALSTTYVSSTSLTAQISASAESVSGTLAITVVNPSPGGGQSGSIPFAVVAGSLAVSVVDLPSGANASIQVSGPGGYTAQVSASQTLQNLAFGTYTLTASAVHFGSYTYSPIAGFTSVSIGSTSPGEATVDYYNVRPDTTKILDAVGLASLSVAADNSTLLISTQSTVAQSLNPGDVLIISSNPVFPIGKVVRITSVSSSAGWFIVMSLPASLMDAYEQYRLNGSEQVDAGQVTSMGAMKQGVRIFRRLKPDAQTPITEQTSDPCANQSALIYQPVDVPITDNLEVSGSITICPTIQASIDWSWFQINAAHLEVDAGETADLTTTLSVSTSLPKTEQLLGTLILPTPVLGVNPNLALYVGAEGAASLSLSEEAVQTGSGQVGFDYANGTVTPLQSFTGSISPTGPPQIAGNASLKGFARAEFGVDLGFGAIDPYVSINPFVQASADTTKNPWWEIQYGFDGQVGFHGLAEQAAKDLGFDPSWSATILGPYTFLQAPGPFQITPASITSIGPAPLVGSATAQHVVISGTSLSYVTDVVLCATSGGCESLAPSSVGTTTASFSASLLPGNWTAMTQDTYGNSNILRFTVYPPPSGVSIQSIQPAMPQISKQSQPLSFSGTGFEQGAQFVICFSNLCNEPVTATVSADGSTASISSMLDHAGLWTAQLINPDGSRTSDFSFDLAGPLSASVAPTGGTINVTNFLARGSGATPGKAVVLQVTPPSGSVQTINLTADANGAFQSGAFTEATAGAYTLLFTDQVTGETSNPSTIVLSKGISAQVYPLSGTVNTTSFTVSGSGATPGATVLLTVLTPNTTLVNETTTATSSGGFVFAPVSANQTGNYTAICEDQTTTTQSQGINWTVAASTGIQASVNPQSGVVNSTSFTISGKGASGNGGVTAHVTTASGVQLYHAQASSGSFSFLPITEATSGNYTVYVSDDTTGSQSGIVGWTVNPDSKTQLQTVSAIPKAWNPVFPTGSTTIAVMPLTISGGGTSPLTGSITSSQPWLTVDGHASENWTAPESIALNANPSSLTAGTYSATLTITSSGASNSPVTVPVTATVRAPLQVATTAIADILGGDPYTTSLSATGGTGAGYKWSLESGYLPYGITLDPTSGTISGTAIAASSTQNLTFSVQVEDSSGADAVGSISVTYRPGLFVLMYSPNNFQFVLGTAYTSANSISIPTSGGVGQITLTAVGLPPGLAMNSSTGLITGTPTKAGSFPVSFYAQDPGGDKGNATFTLQVTEIPLKITTSSLPSAQIGAAYQQSIAAQGGSQAGYTWSVQGNLPPGLQGTTSTGCTQCQFQIAGTPTAAGTYSFTVNLQDSIGENTSQAYTLFVGSSPPQIQAATLPLATIGTPFTFAFSATGGTAPYSWSFVAGSPDPGLQLSSAGTLSGTPTVASTCPSGPSSPWYGAVPAINFQVKVTDANSQSAIQQFCIGTYYPTPSVTTVSPNVIVPDGASHVITIVGSNFRQTSEVFVGSGSQVVSQYVDAAHINVSLLPTTNGLFAMSLTSGGQATFADSYVQTWIVQPAANLSNQNLGFTIADPAPTISNVSAVLNNSSNPCTANMLCQLVINGNGLVFDTQYQIMNPSTSLQRATWPNTALPWNTITTTSFSVPSAGTYTIVISNPNQALGGTATATAQFTVAP